MIKDISVVIQGPLDDRTYEAIDQYQNFGEVIVSTWDTDHPHLLNPATGEYKFVRSSYPDNLESYHNEGSRYFMAQTTLAGVEVATKKYTMKTRSDELYPDLEAMLKNLETYPDRVHTTDNGFWKDIKGAFSNHLFIDKTDNMLKAMRMHVDYSSGKMPDLARRINSKLICAEQTFGYFLMAARGYDILESDFKPVYRENIWITRCVELKGHLHSGQTSKPNGGFKRSTEPYPLGRKDESSGKANINRLVQHIEDIK